jgi:PAS domain S-box-containing protein
MLGEQLAQETDRRTRLEERLADVQAAAQEANCRHAVQLSDLQGRYETALDVRAALEQRAAEDRAAADARQRALEGELDAERTRLAALVAEHDRALREQTDRHRAAEERGRTALADVRTQLERSRHERRRLFERAPHAWCRCAPDGAIVEANHAFVAMLGIRRDRDLRDMNLIAAAQNRTGDLRWLFERARTTGRTETVETEWKIAEGRRLIVRLEALAADEAIDIVAEDITGVRNLQAQLRQARRMEAVGRVASEVAVTCDALLSDVARGAHEWLAGADCDESVHRYVERLLVDVTRAAGFMRQLEIYGREQVRALEPVSARRVLRNLAPVLNRIVGDQIALVLPKSGGSFDVEVDAERLERVFINVAGFARQRICTGGQVRIDLATTAIGRRFAARYSNVRPGDHVLITVTEVPSAGGTDAVADRPSRTDHPGVDLGVLVDLIASCGGHLWLEAQPAGNMVLKIHLPKASVQAAGSRGGLLSKWIRTMPAAGARA